jgi:hypothetical protein
MPKSFKCILRLRLINAVKPNTTQEWFHERKYKHRPLTSEYVLMPPPLPALQIKRIIHEVNDEPALCVDFTAMTAARFEAITAELEKHGWSLIETE